MTGYRTLLFNGVALGVALFQHYFGTLPEVSPETFGAAVAAVNFALRFVTTGPVGGK